MSGLSLLVTLQSELNELSRKRKSLESDVLILEQKINVLDQKLRGRTGNKKMMKLREYLQNEIDRIQKNRLSKIEMQAQMLEDKIKNFRDSKSNSSASQQFGSIRSQTSVEEEFLINSTHFHPRHNSNPFPSNFRERFEKKIKSVPATRPHTSSDTKTYCEYCRENTIQRKPSIPYVHMDHHRRWSSTHLPMCMSINVCKDCTAMRDFFMKLKHEKDTKIDTVHTNCVKNNCVAFFNGKCESPCDLTSSANSNDSKLSKVNADQVASSTAIKNFENSIVPLSNAPQKSNYCKRCKALIDLADEEYEKEKQDEMNRQDGNIQRNDNREKLLEMIRTCESAGACSNCAKILDNSSTGTSQEFAQITDSRQSNDDLQSLSPSILATCDSYALCECCNHNLLKINMPTPSPSIVELECKSHQNCSKCAQVLLDSRKNSAEVDQTPPRLISHEIIYSKSFNEKSSMLGREKSLISVKPYQHNLGIYNPRNKLHEEIKKEMEFQSRVIFDTEDQISKLAVLHKSDENLKNLRHLLDIETTKLEDMKRLAKIEERRPKEEVWWQHSNLEHEEIS